MDIKYVQNGLSWLVNVLSESYVYNWDSDVKANEIKTRFQAFYDYLSKQPIDFTSLSVEEAKALRFQKWESESDLYLFPLYLVPCIPEGLEVTDIFGNKTKFNSKTCDYDIRFGCVSYGINIPE